MFKIARAEGPVTIGHGDDGIRRVAIAHDNDPVRLVTSRYARVVLASDLLRWKYTLETELSDPSGRQFVLQPPQAVG